MQMCHCGAPRAFRPAVVAFHRLPVTECHVGGSSAASATQHTGDEPLLVEATHSAPHHPFVHSTPPFGVVIFFRKEADPRVLVVSASRRAAPSGGFAPWRTSSASPLHNGKVSSAPTAAAALALFAVTMVFVATHTSTPRLLGCDHKHQKVHLNTPPLLVCAAPGR